ncbi:MAG: pitrilysin family protein [Candidatus Aminicenantes bacterium]|jgi:predicted Zn-dependent peptidase
MKRSSSPLPVLVTILTLALVLGPLGADSAFAAKKRKIHQLKYPELNPFKLPPIQKSTTSNGIKLRLIKSEKLPLMNLTVLLNGGYAYDPPAKLGLASITAELLRIGGSKELNSEALDKFLDSHGITISISSGDDYYRINLNCLKENFDTGISLLSKILQSPAFAKEKLEEIKTKMNSTISRRNDTPSQIASREFDQLIYGSNSPFAQTLEYKHLENISTMDIVKTYQTFFAADNMLVGVTGPMEINELEQLFEKHLGSWNTTAKIPPYPKVQAQTHDFKVAAAEKSNINQSYLAIGHLGIKENMEDKAKLMVFNSIFSQGFASRLNTRVRVKMGLTYGITGGVLTEYHYPGRTYFFTFTKTKSTLDAIKAIFDEIHTIRKELVSEEELKEAKDYFLNSHVFKYRTPERRLFRSLSNEFYGRPEDADEQLMEDVKTVTAANVLEMAQKYLNPDKMVTLVVGNQQDIKDKAGDLSQLGKVKEIDISIKPPPLKEKIPDATPEMLQKGSEIITALANTTYKKYKRLKSLESLKDSIMTLGGRTIDIKSKTLIRFPDKLYNQASIMGGMMKVETIIDGKKGVRKQMGKTSAMTEENIEKQKFGDLYDIFNPVKKGKYKFQYLKEEKINGKTYDVIYIFDNQKNWVKFFINQETRFVEIEEKLSQLPGQSGTARTVKSDFKTIEGIPFAFQSKTYVKDKVVMETTTKQIKVNPKIDPSLFKIEAEKK